MRNGNLNLPSRNRTFVQAALTALLATASLAMAAAAAPAPAHAQTSSNWAGYVARASSATGGRFHRVAGTWVVPAAQCASAKRATFSAVWVGLGGDQRGARRLEQVGTDADCSRSGHAHYSSWYELLPADAVNLHMDIAAGDTMSASVGVRDGAVKLDIADLTTAESFTVTRHPSRVDLSSAEWIVEAPSACDGRGHCEVLTLTNFGTASFSAAAAGAGGHLGPASDARWGATALELHQPVRHVRRPRNHFAGGLLGGEVRATPSPLAPGTGAFSVTWAEGAATRTGPAAGA
ncbi:MAG TPA: G1 family glutamic endopeptidase [Solirubrobacteraceae bacterium]|nr:G1 family glutamic endopeptidase [Solirubrobacteraceae bacterium]